LLAQTGAKEKNAPARPFSASAIHSTIEKRKCLMAKMISALPVLAAALVTLSGCGAGEPPASEPSAEAASSANQQEPASSAASGEKAAVYMAPEISAKGLKAVYGALGIAPKEGDRVAVKVSTGEPPSSNYLRQDLIGDFVKGLNGTYVECNTAYGGQRASTNLHYEVAKEHGFEPIALLDAESEMEIPVSGGLQLKTATVGARMADYNFYVVLSHFKGHQMAGYGGALKQLSIGLASSTGKALIHSAGNSASDIFGGDQDDFLESMADASKAAVDYIRSLDGGQLVYINVMNRLSIDCDCNGNPAEPDIHDIGILASTNPVALDQACLDLIYKADGNESFVQRVESLNGVRTIEAAEQIGLDSRAYTIINVGN
jgi:uncharacterized Fe-S center protein